MPPKGENDGTRTQGTDCSAPEQTVRVPNKWFAGNTTGRFVATRPSFDKRTERCRAAGTYRSEPHIWAITANSRSDSAKSAAAETETLNRGRMVRRHRHRSPCRQRVTMLDFFMQYVTSGFGLYSQNLCI